MEKTPLYEEHLRLGARMIDFAGWEMPVQYSGVLEEHEAVRTAAGLFDLSHMGEVEVRGPGALAFLQRVAVNDAAALAYGQAQYSLLCTPEGGIVDDILVYRRGAEEFLLVVNAANRAKDLEWLAGHAGQGVELEDLTFRTALLAVQGPQAERIVGELTDLDLGSLFYYQFAEGEVAGHKVLLSRTGYTGEDGFELYLEAGEAVALWRALWEAGQPYGLKPVGLGARDTLRLEMRYPLYGNDITEETTPLEAGLGWVVKWNKGDFIGRLALERQKQEGVRRRLVGLVMVERGVPRHGYPVLSPEGEPIGSVTSGTYSPTLKENIALAYVAERYAAVGSAVAVEIRGKPVAARVVKTPFIEPRVRRKG